MRSNVGALEGGLQEAFNRLLGIGQEGRAFNQQKFDLQTTNANREFQANVANLQADVIRRNAQTNALGNIAGLGSLMAFSNQFGGGGRGDQALGSTLSKTGGATSGGGGGRNQWRDIDTYLKIAAIGGPLLMACFVATEIFGGWFHPQTVRVRNYILFASNGKFRDFYIKYGKQIAEVIKGNRIMKEILRPIFEEMAEKGKFWMEAYNGKN